MLAKGDVFPDWEMVSDTGETVRSKDLANIRYVMYFYPKDSTPGCTTEAVEFTELYTKFALRNIPVFGVSGDSTASHVKFRDNNGLKVKLLTDPDKEFAKVVGAFGEKKLYGKTVVGSIRSTFIIGKDGKVEEALHNVKAKGHAEKVLSLALTHFKEVE